MSQRRRARVGSQSNHPSPASSASSGPGGRSIRVTWRWMVALYVTMVAAMGLGTIALTRFQQDVFADTTSHFEEEGGALVRVQNGLLTAEVPMAGILYNLDRATGTEGLWRQFQASNRAIEAGFAELRTVAHGSALETVKAAEELWGGVVEEVGATRAAGRNEAVTDALKRGEDPFADTVWQPLSETQEALAAALADAVRHLDANADFARSRQEIVEPIVLALVVAALGLGAASGWRLSRRVVHPLMSLRKAALRMRDGDLAEPVTVPPRASSEVTELADTMSEMAAALSQIQGRLTYQANTDTLTGLPNRHALSEFLHNVFPVATDDQLALLLIDVDDFKFVNDSLGHAAGDAVLRAVALRLRGAARSDDMVARLGGDEFALVIRAHDAASTAAVVAERVLDALRDAIVVDGTAVKIGCSIGIAVGAPHAAGSDALLRNADIAMYMAKSRGKHCFQAFDAAMHTTMVSRVGLKGDLGRAAENDELEVHYQPIIDLESETLLGFEALVRWRHPTRGLLPPVEFLELAEETGDILTIGGWVIDRACQDLACIQAASGDKRRLWMAVNVSARQVCAPDLPDVVRASLARHGIDPTALILEVTEQSLMSETAVACDVLTELRSEGVMVAIDDFGTGFSSLRLLQQLPADLLKIDRSFVSGGVGNADRSVILEAIVAMGRGLGLALVAEGIEYSNDLERLRSLGPMAGQGYLFARPMPAAQAVEFAGADVAVESAPLSV